MRVEWAKQEEFNQFIVSRDVVGFFDTPITLKSGRQSNWYVNFRSIAEDAKRLEVLSEFVVDFLTAITTANRLKKNPLCIYGVPEGATKVAVIAQMAWAKRSEKYAEGSHPVPMGRAKPKEHGMPKDKFFVGEPRGGSVILEDVTTTGGSLITTLDNLKSAEIEVVAAIGLANRMEKRDDGNSVEQAIESRSERIPYFYLSSALELLPLAVRRLNPSATTVEAIKEEFRTYGTSELRL